MNMKQKIVPPLRSSQALFTVPHFSFTFSVCLLWDNLFTVSLSSFFGLLYKVLINTYLLSTWKVPQVINPRHKINLVHLCCCMVETNYVSLKNALISQIESGLYINTISQKRVFRIYYVDLTACKQYARDSEQASSAEFTDNYMLKWMKITMSGCMIIQYTVKQLSPLLYDHSRQLPVWRKVSRFERVRGET